MNDIIGAPEIVVIKGRVFWFSPLTDFECSCLESWLRWRLEKDIELEAEEAFDELATVVGATQLLYQSIRRTEPTETIATLAVFLDKDAEACEKIHQEWMRINYSGLEEFVPKTNDSKSGSSGTVSDVYTFLGRHYKWASPSVVANMTRRQQLIYIQAIAGKNGSSLFFDSEEAFQRWQLSQPSSK